MDILAFQSDDNSSEGARLELINPLTGDKLTAPVDGQDEPKVQYLILPGPDDPNVMRALDRVAARARKQQGKDQSDEQIEAEKVSDCTMVAGLVIGGEIFMSGEWLQVTRDVAFKMFKAAPAFRGQALKFMMDRTNFIKG